MTYDNNATSPQKDFILSLLKSRRVSTEVESLIDSKWGTLTKQEASLVIDSLKSSPFKVEFKEVSPIHGLPLSKYAIPAHYAEGILQDDHLGGADYLFIEIAKFKDTVYMRRLYGSLGNFRREKLSLRDRNAVVEFLTEGDPKPYITKFGEIYTCCGKCGAPLTDAKSMAMFLGPECRKSLGV